jgi:hypothetical protein
MAQFISLCHNKASCRGGEKVAFNDLMAMRLRFKFFSAGVGARSEYLPVVKLFRHLRAHLARARSLYVILFLIVSRLTVNERWVGADNDDAIF